jgi:carotenoid 1,2-hydratase
MSGVWTIPPLPQSSGAYRWFYADAHAGPYTVVSIFMVGAVFSPRYARAAGRGARPVDHCAVNCAVYRGGRRIAWAFTEHGGAEVGRDWLRIGGSRFAYGDGGGVEIVVRERTAPYGRPLHVELELEPSAPPAPGVLVDGRGPHRWEVRLPRARARLAVDGEAATGVGYHDTNHGPDRLGAGLPGWRWTRIHGPEATWIRYRPPAPARGLEVVATADRTTLREAVLPGEPLRRSGWGLPLPVRLAAGPAVLPVAAVLESSPFYGRLEARAPGMHAVGEVADFHRFHSPLVRWMARFRMRVERAA